MANRRDGDRTENVKSPFAGNDEAELNPALGLAEASPELPPAGRQYLFVLEGESSWMFQLPANGDVVVGRAEQAALRLRDGSVSRQHARLVLSAGDAHVMDLGSQNGTWVNGERITGARPLVSGDWIYIGSTTLVFHASPRRGGSRFILELRGLQRRVEEELERSLRFDRPLTLAAIDLSPPGIDRTAVGRALTTRLRLTDVVAWGGTDELLVLMPETGPEGAERTIERLREAILPLARQSHLGFATCPADGCEAETLIAAARLAAHEAAPGQVASAAQTFLVRDVGERKVIIADPAMTRLYGLIARLSGSDLPVLVCGETGTGKDLVAAAIHHWSPRAGRPFVTLNCAALPETLVESELFGHGRGAFSGAVAAKPGLLETAAGGTVLLDEIGDLSPATQAKLLRVLETKRVTRLGDVHEREIDIRIVAATNRDLQAEARAGRFRQDLFFRLCGATLWLPPLRDRRRELPILAQAFLRDACNRAGRTPMVISHPALRALHAHPWPGNVRELKNVMEYLAAASPEPVLEAWHLMERLGADAPPAPPVPEPLARPIGPGVDSNLTSRMVMSEQRELETQLGIPPSEVSAVPRQSPGMPGRDAGSDDSHRPGEGGESGAAASPRSFRPIDDELRDLERMRMTEALNETGGNQTRAAQLIGMPLRTFQLKVRQYHLRKGP